MAADALAGSLTPPWSDDNPELWVELTVAARIYYRLNPTYLRALALRGRLKERTAIYANRYWVRLPNNPAILSKVPPVPANR